MMELVASGITLKRAGMAIKMEVIFTRTSLEHVRLGVRVLTVMVHFRPFRHQRLLAIWPMALAFPATGLDP